MESPAVFVIAYCALVALRQGASQLSLPFLFLLMWEIHYIYRTFAFPVLMAGGGKRFPVLLVLFAMVFNSANGFVNGFSLFLSDRVYPDGYLLSVPFIVGATLFFSGLVIHFQSDRILRRMRRKSSGYAIPKGWLFNLVSAPNYFGEIIQWIGWAILTWSLAGLAFAVFTVANLLPRGLSHHKWYSQHFDDYPEKRRAVIPFFL
jgi:protein-S-isoprenylcysteine O-methyltransferase Ste14